LVSNFIWTIYWSLLIATAFFTPFITSAIDFRYGYVFAACNAVGGLLVYLFVMEGQGRTLEEIDTMYLSKIKPWKSNKWVSPPPHEIARIRREAGTHDGDEEIAEPKERDEIEKPVETRENGVGGAAAPTTNGAVATDGAAKKETHV
jgi:SP family sugar:H+ symporter-like MFS transporter